MIQVNETLNISSEDFFDCITESVINDIQASTGKSIAKTDINGYTYDKTLKNKLGRFGTVHVSISEYKYPKYYKAIFIYSAGQHEISYEVKPLSCNKCNVEYIENFISNNMFGNLNSKLVNFVYRNKAVRRIKLMLQSIEKSVLNYNKKDINE